MSERLTKIKSYVNMQRGLHTIDYLVNEVDAEWLLEQAEKAERLEKENERLKKALEDKTKFLELIINNIPEEKYGALKARQALEGDE